MWSPATRSLNMNGPTQTGFVAKFAPSAVTAFGDRIIPERSASCAVIGAYRFDKWRTTVYADGASTDVTGESSLARAERGSALCRSSDIFTAAALKRVPSLNRMPFRSLIVTVRLFVEKVG